MGEQRDSWRETFSAFGEALVEVLRAEMAVITEVWSRSFRELAVALGLLAAAGYVSLVCLPALLIFALVFGLHTGLGWPLWGSALAVAALVTLIVALVAALALRRLRDRFENPVETVKHRVADHAAWWNERILSEGEGAVGADSLGQGNDGAGAVDGASERGDGTAGEPPSGS